jgi:ABC-type Mn2+/Zn2+ transport system permease subunit
MQQSIAVQIGHFRVSRKLVLRVDAVSNASLAALFLAASWDGLFEFFGLPLPRPAYYAQLLGAALLAVAVLEWELAETAAARAVAGAVAVGSGLAAAVLVVWLVAGETGADSHGIVVLWSAAGFLALAAAVHVLVSRVGS